MAIGGVQNQHYQHAATVGRNTQQNYAKQLNSGRKQNSAADGAAELAAAKLLEKQARGYQVGYNNQASGRDAINIADGAQASINDYAQDIYADSIRAMNGTMSADDRQAIQNNVSQLTQGMNDVANNTRYNETNLLKQDGNVNIVNDGEGTSQPVSTTNATSSALGMNGYSVLNGTPNLDQVNGAMSRVSRNRSINGAQSNALEYGMNYNSIARENTIASESRKADTDYASTITNYRSRQTMDQYRLQMQRQQMMNMRTQNLGLLN